MTTIRKAASKMSANETGHRRAMAKPRLLELVSTLRQSWAAIELLERGEQLRELTALGCSARGLQLELKQSATSIRRHMKPAELPEKDCGREIAEHAQMAVLAIQTIFRGVMRMERGDRFPRSLLGV